MTDLGVADARAKLSQHFANFPGDQYGEGWTKLWEQGDFLPWDKLVPSPALIDTLKNHQGTIGNAMTEVDGKPRRKRALVPGCGRGVDVLLLESVGYDAVGLEYSAKAVEECEEYARQRGHEYVVRDEKIGRGSKKYIQGDFYASDWMEKVDMAGQTFDLIYDYTFFCAMNPKMRPQWAKRMSELLGPSPRANLICLEFPTTKGAGAGGPPFASPSKAYMEHLSHPGQEIPYDSDGNVKINPLAPASPDGLERVAHWTPADSHQMGKDQAGNVLDKIAVWRHR